MTGEELEAVHRIGLIRTKADDARRKLADAKRALAAAEEEYFRAVQELDNARRQMVGITGG